MDTVAFSIGTNSCNVGDVWANWISFTNDHPVIAQHMYRLKNGRFEQIGMSWLKHGFFALSGSLCSGIGGCQGDFSGRHLGVGCSDPYSASLNGQAGNLGPRSDVNAHTGEFPYPWSAPPIDPIIGRRLQVRFDDIDPDLNEGALYFFEAQYVHYQDNPEVTTTGGNNASYRGVNMNAAGGASTYIGTTVVGSPAIEAWKAADATVLMTLKKIAGYGHLRVASQAYENGDGTWDYEYLVHNLDYDRSIGYFEVPVAGCIEITPGPTTTRLRIVFIGVCRVRAPVRVVRADTRVAWCARIVRRVIERHCI